MARKTPQRPRAHPAPRTPSAAPTAADRTPRAPRMPAPNVLAAVDYESDLAVRYQHVKRDLVRIVVIGVLLFGVIFAAKLWAAQSGGQLFFSF